VGEKTYYTTTSLFVAKRPDALPRQRDREIAERPLIRAPGKEGSLRDAGVGSECLSSNGSQKIEIESAAAPWR